MGDEGNGGLKEGLEDGIGDFESSAFEALEKDFQEVLGELVGDKSLEKFRLEYEKLHRALKKSHEQEKRLIKKCRELNSEIVNNAAKVQTALKLSQEDQSTIGSLKKEIEKAWKMVDASHEKERTAKETIQNLKDEIVNLSRLVEQGAGLSMGQENTLNELTKERDELLRKTDEQALTIRDLNARAEDLCETIELGRQEKASMQEATRQLHEQLETKLAEQQRDARRRERLDKEMKDLKMRLERKQQENDAQTASLREADEETARLEANLKESRNVSDKYLRDYEALSQKAQKLADEVEAQQVRIRQAATENHGLQDDLKRKHLETTKAVNDLELAKRRLDKEKKHGLQLRQTIEDEKAAQQNLHGQIEQLKKELADGRKREDGKEKEVDTLKRGLELQEKAVSREQQKTKVVADQVKVSERTSKNLENEIYAFKQEASKQRKLIYQLEKDREKYGVEASEAGAKYHQALEQIKLKEMQMGEMQKKVVESENKLKQQQQLYEAVRSDRNLYSKNLIESQDEIAEMKRKFKIMNHQVEQLKEEITAKDHALVKEHFDHQKVEKQKEQLKNELSKMKSLLEANEQTINAQNAEILKLTHMIQKMDDEALRQRKEYDQVINERDILGTQLIRRNDELALLYEKIKIQQSTLRNGETQYRERLHDIRVLKLKIGDMKRQLAINKNQGGSVGDLKREIFNLQRELLQEKTKVKALSEELENPMNVHRWRKLEGSDPATYEMIQKIQTLQKRLIAKTEQVVEKDLVIQEKEKLYAELKSILARQPGPEVAEQLSVYQQTLKDKTRQMKAMASELNMHQAQVNEYKFEIERISRELQDMKRKYYLQKRSLAAAAAAAAAAAPGDLSPKRGSNNQDEAAASEHALLQQAPPRGAGNRIAGGGFSFAAQP
ncbi:Cilia- and flagella-associated protein 58 [Hondaea fermentalgiana]|uniref:Cilia-and flagella-associated protein 58 n=1 Tax=Hondaea fermentalgiana TaxID=2315210 RepID=A0A2R5H2Q8_9STRA|nr:Cilia- and flagella-associated protein 58 [Hondaea fermentalgiana]|eukprot:GBG34684.1 Cilia- and flagella-associated protein 58 [Hondaea fermentalgiana]